MYRERPKSPSFTHSGEATRMFRTAMSLEEGYKDKGEVIQNASDRQTGRGECRPETQHSEQSQAASVSQPFPDPLSHLVEAQLRWEPGLALQSLPHTRLFVISHHPFSCTFSVKPISGSRDLFLMFSRFIYCLYCPLCQGCGHPADSPRKNPDNCAGSQLHRTA